MGHGAAFGEGWSRVWDSTGTLVEICHPWGVQARKAGWKPALRFGRRVRVRFNGGWNNRTGN